MDPRILIDRPCLLDLVHDRSFDLNEFAFDRQRREVCLYLGGYDIKGPYDQKCLRVTDVSDAAINDKAGIGIYSINQIKFRHPFIRITSNVPLEIVLTIGEKCTIHITNLRDRKNLGIKS